MSKEYKVQKIMEALSNLEGLEEIIIDIIYGVLIH